MYQIPYYYLLNFSIIEFVVSFVLIILILFYSKFTQDKNIEQHKYYQYYTIGLTAKLIVVLVFCYIYINVYGGGDTVDYFHSSIALSNVLKTDTEGFFNLLLNGNKAEYYSYFTAETGYPEWHMWRDPVSFFVVRLITPLTIITQKSYIITSIIVAWISYLGIWKLYTFFCTLYPKLYKYFAFSILFLPSLLFWGSGILKDTFTLASICWLVYSSHQFFILKKFSVKNALIILISAWMVITIKTYIFIALMPGLILWFFFEYLQKIENKVIRFLFIPFVLGIGFLFITLLFSGLNEKLGAYSDVDAIIKKAQITQEDLTREAAYGKNFYNIGKIDNSLTGLISKMPDAIVAGIFRPFVWEANNLFMILSGIENLILLLLLLYGIFKIGIVNYFKTIANTPIVFFSFLFTILFAFGVGLATANFGALVRYKIPLLPFFLSALFIQIHLIKSRNEENTRL